MSRKVMLVSNESRLSERLSNLLGTEDYEVELFSSGLECWFAVLKEPPAIVVADADTTALRGLALAHLLKQHEGMEEVRFVLLAAPFSTLDQEAGMAAVDACLLKPIEPERVAQEVFNQMSLTHQVAAVKASTSSSETSPASNRSIADERSV